MIGIVPAERVEPPLASRASRSIKGPVQPPAREHTHETCANAEKPKTHAKKFNVVKQESGTANFKMTKGVSGVEKNSKTPGVSHLKQRIILDLLL